MKLRAGEAGVGAVVTWAHVSELEDPAAFLEGGELILTGGIGVPRDADGQVEYVGRLHERGAAGLAIARGPHTPRLTSRGLAVADRLGFPVLTMPVEVAFVDIARLVAAANDQSGQQRLVRHLQIFETLQEYQADTMRVEDFMLRLSEVSGFDISACSEAGHPILPGVPLPETDESPVPSDRDPPTVPGGYRLPVVVAGRIAARVTMLRRADGFPAGLAAAQNLATVIGIPLRELYQRREAERREAAEVLSRLISEGPSRAEAASRLVECGFEPMKDVVIAAIRNRDEHFDDAEIHHRLCDRRIPSLLITRDDLLVVVPDVEEAVAALADVDFDLAIGVSAPFAPGEGLITPWRQARWSLERAESRGERLVRFESTDTAGEWLPFTRNELEGVVDRILGPVVRYDAAHGAELIESLAVLLRHDRRVKAAAADLDIHPHTLAYRMRTVERLTDRRLSELPGLVDLWLAMRARDIVASEDRGSGT
jgi:purine catabolism regulator